MNQLHSLKNTRQLAPWIEMKIESSRYLIKTVDQFSELEEVFRLRSEIFSEEYGRNPPVSGLDVDRFDLTCDHLIIVCRKSNQIVGTYRVLCSSFTNHFYSETEFEMEEYLSAPGTKLELGRACITKEHRNGATLALLWKGIMQYASLSGARYLFGCSSVKLNSHSQAEHFKKVLESNGNTSADWNIQPKPQYQFVSTQDTAEEIEIPPLLRCYLKAGAKVYGFPAYDAEFNCSDFLTIIDLEQMSNAYEKRFAYETAI
jgi:putative hemolysin